MDAPTSSYSKQGHNSRTQDIDAPLPARVIDQKPKNSFQQIKRQRLLRRNQMCDILTDRYESRPNYRKRIVD